MKVYTIQHLKVWEELQKTGQYQTNPQYICEETFQEAYQWLNRMAQKYQGWQVKRPIWVWTKRPDLRKSRFFQDPAQAAVEPHVLLTLNCPDQQLLLSEFGLWHCVLNYFPVAVNDQQAKSWDKLLEPYGGMVHKAPLEIIEKMKASWEQILYLNPQSFAHFDKEFCGELELQGIIPQINLHQVERVQPFEMVNKAKKII